jgi:hypothetical protein
MLYNITSQFIIFYYILFITLIYLIYLFILVYYDTKQIIKTLNYK